MTDWPIDEIVEVEWGDAHHAPGWLNPADEEAALKPLPTRSVGYLFKENDEVIVLVETQNDGQLGGPHTIPKGMITKITPLKRDA
jgi:hypothetical protein